jgi:hypothetical protein
MDSIMNEVQVYLSTNEFLSWILVHAICNSLNPLNLQKIVLGIKYFAAFHSFLQALLRIVVLVYI